MVAVVVSLRTAFTFSINVAIESQPAAVVSVSEYVPAAVSDKPFQMYGNWLAQIVVVVVSLSTAFTFSINVAIESQPVAVVVVSLYVPAAVSMRPFQLYGN